MAWNKVKRLFVVSDDDAPVAKSAPDIAALEAQVSADLAQFEVPAGVVGTLPSGTDVAALKGTIEFQSLYDQAGIPNTDEVEQLERFLGGLDSSLPQASHLAAAKAFLSAIGKAPTDVMNDAARKIEVVRAVGEAKGGDAQQRLGQLQGEIDNLQRQIEECKVAMQQLHAEAEGVKAQCASEENRLQEARVFFGAVGAPALSGSK